MSPSRWPSGWPTATLDRIARLEVLAAALPGVAIAETELDAPFEQVWQMLTDFERAVPAFDADVARCRVVERRGDPGGTEKLRLVSYQSARVLWLPAVFDVDLSPGWCWMVSRPQAYVVGMAAEPDGERTRFAHLEGLAIKMPWRFRAVLRPLLAGSRWRHQRHVRRDLAGMRRLVGAKPRTAG